MDEQKKMDCYYKHGIASPETECWSVSSPTEKDRYAIERINTEDMIAFVESELKIMGEQHKYATERLQRGKIVLSSV